MSATSAEIEATARVRKKLAELLSDGSLDSPDGVTIPSLVTAITTEVDADADWRRPLLRLYLSAFVQAEVRETLAATRGLLVMGHGKNGKLVSKKQWERHLDAAIARVHDWVEHSGGRHMRLMSMTAADLLTAAAEREKRGLTELRIAVWQRRLAERLEPGQILSDVLTERQVAIEAEKFHIVYSAAEVETPFSK